MNISAKDLKKFSLRETILSAASGEGVPGVAREFSEQCSRDWGLGRASGVFIPWQALLPTYERDLNVGTFVQGGATVQSTVASEVVPLLRNKTACGRLGATLLTNLSGPNLLLPRQTSAATPYSLPETGTTTKSNQTFDQITLTPKRVSVSTEYSKQLVMQSSVDVENFIRDDLMKVLGIKWDSLMLTGAGANSEATGLLNVNGVGSAHFGGSATLSKLVSFETTVSKLNADPEGAKLAYLTTPGVRGVLKVTPKIGSTFPIFIWETNPSYGDDGMVNSCRAAATNQLPSDLVVFGNFKDLVLASWGGPDVIINPFSRDTDAVVRITIHTWADVAVLHPQSFVVSDDAGSQ